MLHYPRSEPRLMVPPAFVGLGIFLGGFLELKFAEEWGVDGLPGTITGALAVTYSIWCRLGRTASARAWSDATFGADLALLGIPGMGLFLLAIGVGRLFDAPPWLGLTVIAVAAVHFIVVMIGGGDCPWWWMPKWARKALDEENAPSDALGATLMAYSEPPQVVSSEKVAEVFSGEPVAAWKGGWVHDPATGRRDHPLAWKGRVEGRLAWYNEGLAFSASRQEDRMRGKATVLTARADEISNIEVVPPRADADGVQHAGFLYRSMFPRLVVHVRGHRLLFDVARGKARQVAAFLNTRLDGRS